jgi:DNA-binding GntR family transcriptional regulator
VREVLQGLGARLCAEQIAPDQLQQLAATLEAMEAAKEDGDLEAVTEADTRFHHLIGEYAGNVVVVELIGRIEEAYRNSSRALMDLRGRAMASVVQHAAIIEAIRAHDPDQAEDAMRNHVRSVVQSLLALGESTDATNS